MKRKGSMVLLSLLILLMSASGFSEPLQPVHDDEKCPVCGMFVAKFDQWLTQIVAENSRPLVFDGVKDMMAYYFDPSRYGGSIDLSGAEIWVRNYYTLDYIDGRGAWYVAGSDVVGPMGEELIPFSTRDEAEQFKKDHHGAAVLRFEEITAERIMEMKKKHMMKMGTKKP